MDLRSHDSRLAERHGDAAARDDFQEIANAIGWPHMERTRRWRCAGGGAGERVATPVRMPMMVCLRVSMQRRMVQCVVDARVGGRPRAFWWLHLTPGWGCRGVLQVRL